MKKLFLLTGVVFFACLVFVSAPGAQSLFNSGTYERFEQLGSELSSQMQQLDRQLEDVQSRRTDKARAAFLKSARRLAGRTTEINSMLAQMEQELIENGADDIFVERHRAKAAALKERFATMSESIRYGDIDDIIERDLLSGRKKRSKAMEPSRIQGRGARERKTSAEIVAPKGRELTPDETGALNSPRPGFGLLEENDTFKLVKFDFHEPMSAGQPSQPLLSPVAAWDLDLPRHVRPIQVAGLSTVQALVSQATIAAIAPPVAADLLEDELGDVVFTDSITALADSLGRNPIRMYEWVKNTIDFQPYRGSLKGAAQTLAEGCGNDVDIASLLIALLRYSGYPARYAEVRAIVDIDRAMQWLGLKSPEMVGYYLSTGDIQDVEDLYRASAIAQSAFRHTCVEVYLPYADYRGSGESERHKLWVPLAPAFKQYRSTAGAIHDPDLGFDAEQFIQSLEQFSSIADSGLVDIDSASFQDFMTTATADYQAQLQDYLDARPDMTLREFYGYDEVAHETFPFLPITLPFATDPEQYRPYSAVPLEEHHQVSVQLSYWGVDLDIELETLEIDFRSPTSLVAGQRLVLSYVPSTSEDYKTLARYTGTLFETPLYLIHMRPQLRLNGRLVAENLGKDAEISMGLEETLRVSIVRPGEDPKNPTRTSDYVTTVGDHTAIVLGLGRGSSENITAALARFGEALDERTKEMDRLLGEQLHITGSSYFYQLDTHADLIARQLGVRWFRNPSDIRVARHLKVSYFYDIWPIRITETNIRVDVAERVQAVPMEPDWHLRDAFLRSETLQGSVFEHMVLQQLFRQESVSAVKLVAEAVNRGVPLYQFTQDMESIDLSPLQLEPEDLEIINRELTEYEQSVLVPAERIEVGTFTGVGIISTTPPGNPLGPYRMGYFIVLKGADPYVIDGGQIVEEIDTWNMDFVDPQYRDWIQVAGLLADSTTAIITNSESIRDGNVPVNTLIRGIAQNVMALQLAQIQAVGVGGIGFSLAGAMGQISAMYQARDSLNDFMHNTWILYIDYENELYNWENNYFPSIDNGERTVKYALINLNGFGVIGQTPAITSTHPDFELVGDPVPTAGTLGEGFFTFRMNNAENLEPGDTIPVMLQVQSPEGREVRTTGTFLAAPCGLKNIYINAQDDRSAYPLMPGATVEVHAEVLYENMELAWEIDLERTSPGILGSIIAQEGNSCWLSIDENTRLEDGSGYIVLKVKDAQSPACEITRSILVGCETCAQANGCPDGSLKCVDIQQGIDFKISLGKAAGGMSAGSLYIQAGKLRPEAATPKTRDAVGAKTTSGALGLESLAQGLEVVYTASGDFSSVFRDVNELYADDTLRQIIAPEAFIDILSIDDYSYQIRFYPPSARGEKNDEGMYELNSGSAPTAVWTVRNQSATKDVCESLLITETIGGVVKSYEYQNQAGSNLWTLIKGDSDQVIEVQTTALGSDEWLEVRTEKDGQGRIASKTSTLFRRHARGRAVAEKTIDPDAARLITSTQYDPETGQMLSRTQPDGSTTTYTYDEQGRTLAETSSWLDSAANRSYSYDYTPVDPQDSNLPQDARRPRTVTETIQGTAVATTYYSYTSDAQGNRIEIIEQASAPGAAFGAAGNQRTTRIYYPKGTGSVESGRLKSIAYSDGRLDSYSYLSGTYERADNEARGNFLEGFGSDLQTVVTHGTVTHPDGIPGKTTREVTTENLLGRTMMQETLVYTGSGYELVSWSENTYDNEGHIIQVVNSDGTMNSANWDCCGKTDETDARGMVTNYEYDFMQRVEHMTRTGAHGPVITSYTYDASGRRLSQTMSAGDLSQTTSSVYDGAGRLKSSTGPDGLVTNYSYAAGGLISTVTRPGGSTEITERYLDGKIKSVTGTAVIARFYEYGVNPDGTQYTTVYTKDPAGPVWEKSVADMLGRTVRTERPGFGGTVEITENFYNDKGQLIKTTSPGMAATLYVYDELGEQSMSGLDVDGNGILELASKDRISTSSASYQSYDNAWWQKSEQQVYATENSATPTTVSTQLSRLTGLGENGLVRENVSIDMLGNRMVSRTIIDRSAAQETSIVDYPDSTIDAVSVSVNGLLMSSTDKSGIETTFAYDALGRREGVTDPRTGSSTTGYTAQGRVDWVQDTVGNRTVYGYNAQTGEKILETNPDNTNVRYSYNNQGQIMHTWGSATYPVSYEYDGYGRLERMFTFRDGTGFDGEAFPAGASGDETLWLYDEPSGLLAAKQDAEGKQVTYTYAAGGRLHTRTWAREGGTIVTTYNYDPATGELVTIDYSDATPDVQFTYDRLGRQKTVEDAAGSRTFAYTNALQLEAETITGLISETITRNYDGLGRSAGFSLGAGYDITYAYDTTGRFNNVGWTAEDMSGNTTYVYVPNSHLLQSMTTDSGLATTYAYEPHRNLRTRIRNEHSGSVISQYDYVYDSLGRRTSVQNSGAAFAQAAFNLYGYNNRSELTGSQRYIGIDPGDTTSPVNAEARSYLYDNIGNRESAIEALTKQITYDPNPLNQYTQITTNAGTPVTDDLHYDEDGNLIAGIVGCAVRTALTYDAENRLIAVEPQTPAPGTRKAEFTYDYMSRRVQKQVSDYNAGSWSAASETRFLYDGWNLVREVSIPTLDPGLETSVLYVWGLDLSGTLQGAGGIGGLLARITENAAHHYTYDANGNVGQLVNAAAGIIAAHYEYDPFGNTINSNGLLAEVNPYRFSTKYLDAETGLYYYGYRNYSADLGRWLNRDPAEEDGGLNIYAQEGNNPVNKVDALGLALYAFDGTANIPENETNVWLTWDAGWSGLNSHYEKGIGNDTEYSIFTRLLRKATGWGLKAKSSNMLKEMEKYINAGDTNVDVIGFSRGAVTAIVFAEVIEKLKEKGVNPFCKIDRIRFMGLYDPVPGPSMRSRPSIPTIVDSTAIAYSIDEKRNQFKPSVYSGSGIVARRFRGGHSDVGGGYDDRGLANISLEWMIFRGQVAGAPFRLPVTTKRSTMIRHQERMFGYSNRALMDVAPGIPMHDSVHRLVSGPVNKTKKSLFSRTDITQYAYYLDSVAQGNDFYNIGDQRF
jgi:RHS repeat-associated protein